jgi:hypothetical protein
MGRNGLMRLKTYIKEDAPEKYIYFGHPQAFYNTPEEKKVEVMARRKWPNHLVINPNQTSKSGRYRFGVGVKKRSFGIFYDLMDRSEFGIFMPLEDGRWSGGVHKEMMRAKKSGKDVYEVNPWKNTIKKIDPAKIKPISPDDPYYKKFAWDPDPEEIKK